MSDLTNLRTWLYKLENDHDISRALASDGNKLFALAYAAIKMEQCLWSASSIQDPYYCDICRISKSTGHDPTCPAATVDRIAREIE